MIEFNNKDHGRAIAKAIPRNFNPELDPVVSNVNSAGKLLGGVIYDGWTGAGVGGGLICMHQAGFSKHWLTRDMLWSAFDYPFMQLQVDKVIGTIPASNRQLLALNLRLGYSVEAIIRGGYPGTDMLVMSMTKDECRWLALTPRGIRKPFYEQQ